MCSGENLEKLTREEMAALQAERLKKIVSWAYDKSLFYKKTFDKAKIKPDDIQTVSDVRKLPFLTLSEINRTDAGDFLTLPFSSIVRINHIGEAGKEIAKFFTRDDVRNNVEMMVRCLLAVNVTRGSLVGVLGDLSDNKFLDALYALESIGATVVLLGTDYRKWQKILEFYNFDTLISTQQLVMRLIIQLQTDNESLADYPVKKIICMNVNNIQNPLQQHIEARSDAVVYNLFAPVELGSAGLIFQCRNEIAHHVQEYNYLAEIVRFNSDEIVSEADHMGELVITTLKAQAMPLIRYRTGQAVRRVGEACPCGRTLMRIATPFTKSSTED